MGHSFWGHYTKWNKPVTKPQIPFESTSTVPRVENWETERVVVGSSQGRENELCLMVQSFIFARWKVLEMNVGGCTTTWMYLMGLDYTVKNGLDGKLYVACISPQLEIVINNNA